jgi:hypothetical protein
MDVSLLQSLSYVAAAIGVCAAAIYYVLTLRTNQKNIQTTLETRQAQFMNQISDSLTSVETMKIIFELWGMEWTDWEDFEKRWGSTGNPESAARRMSLFYKVDNIGWLLKKKLLDPEWVYSQFHSLLTPMWIKWEPYVMQTRKAFNSPTIYIGFEYLGKKLVEIETAKGIKAVIPTTLKGASIAR